LAVGVRRLPRFSMTTRSTWLRGYPGIPDVRKLFIAEEIRRMH
jgi:hypothetical protein